MSVMHFNILTLFILSLIYLPTNLQFYFQKRMSRDILFSSFVPKKRLDELSKHRYRGHKRTLLLGGNNINKTADKVEFEYPQHFTRVFKRSTGKTSSQFLQASNLNYGNCFLTCP